MRIAQIVFIELPKVVREATNLSKTKEVKVVLVQQEHSLLNIV